MRDPFGFHPDTCAEASGHLPEVVEKVWGSLLYDVLREFCTVAFGS